MGKHKTKPKGRPRLNRSHPLARGLVLCELFKEGAGLEKDEDPQRGGGGVSHRVQTDFC